MRIGMSNLGAAVVLLGWVAFFPASTPAQQAKAPARNTKATPPAQSPAAQTPDDPDQSQEYNFAVEIQVVTVPVTVTDRKGQFITDLDKRDFTILDNGEPQRIENFELSSEPLSLALLVETSSRVQPLLPQLRGTGILVTQQILGESGEAAILTFDREVKIVQDFTENSDQIEAALRHLSTGPDQDRLSDAVGRAIFLLQQRPRGRRKVILVISESRDRGSTNRLGNVLRGAQQLGISVYTVGLSTMKALLDRPGDQGGPSSPYPPGVITRPLSGGQLPTPDTQSSFGAANVNVLEIVSDLVTYAKNLIGGNPLGIYAAGTGAADFPSDNKAKFEKALSRIGEELHNQYVLTYRPNNLKDMGYHSIQVTLSRRELEARFRPGYVLAPPAPRSSSSPAAPSSSSQEPTPAGP
jgi:VWFA-related protein